MKRTLILIAAFFVGVEGMSLVSSAHAATPEGLSPRLERKLARRARTGARNTLAQVCSKIKTARLLLKSEASDHINRGDPRASGYTLVCAADCPANFPATFYYCDGSVAGQLGYYGTFSGNGRPRAYGGAGGAAPHSASAIASAARRKRCGPTLYLRMSNKRNSSCSPFSATGRTGGV